MVVLTLDMVFEAFVDAWADGDDGCERANGVPCSPEALSVQLSELERQGELGMIDGRLWRSLA